jgi:three-Cys-motif partner protein
MAEDDDGRLFRLPPATPIPKKLRLRRTSDAVIELREFGGWTLEKLRVLELYFKVYSRVAGNGTYIDGFAGRGSVAVVGSDVENKGSVRLALDSKAFKGLWVFEIDPATMADLKKNLSYWYPRKRLTRVHPVLGDFNVEVARLLAEQVVPRNRPCFAFLDPNSTELSWETSSSWLVTKTRSARRRHARSSCGSYSTLTRPSPG